MGRKGNDTSISTITPSETGTVKTQVFSLDASINSVRQVLPKTRPGVPSAALPVTRRWRDQVTNVVPELNLPKTPICFSLQCLMRHQKYGCKNRVYKKTIFSLLLLMNKMLNTGSWQF